jgi:hypothetical protein
LTAALMPIDGDGLISLAACVIAPRPWIVRLSVCVGRHSKQILHGGRGVEGARRRYAEWLLERVRRLRPIDWIEGVTIMPPNP